MFRRSLVVTRRAFATSAKPIGKNAGRDAVFVDGCRTPFQMSGTGYKDLLGWQLGRLALHGLAERNPSLDLASIDRVIYGCVIQEVLTANVGRESALAAGYPQTVPANTVTMVKPYRKTSVSFSFVITEKQLSKNDTRSVGLYLFESCCSQCC
jgi:hypothetical protein